MEKCRVERNIGSTFRARRTPGTEYVAGQTFLATEGYSLTAKRFTEVVPRIEGTDQVHAR